MRYFNVVYNAVSAVGENGTITFSVYQVTKDNEEFLAISILDNGCGIRENELPNIFLLGTSYWGKKPGSGYGLWRTNNIIKDMGGHIDAKSEFGKGTEITIFLPLEYNDKKEGKK